MGKQSTFRVPRRPSAWLQACDLSAGCGWGTGARLWSMNEAADANQLMQAWLQRCATPHLLEHITLSPSTRYISQTLFLFAAQGSAVETQLYKMGQPSFENVIRHCDSPVAQVKADLMCFLFVFFQWKCFIKMGQNIMLTLAGNSMAVCGAMFGIKTVTAYRRGLFFLRVGKYSGKF